MRVIVVTPPVPVVSLSEAKQHLRVQHTAEDALITGMVAAATQLIDGPAGWLGRSLGVQTLEARFDTFGPGLDALPYGPVIAIESVSYVDTDGVVRTADPALYRLSGAIIEPVYGQRWPESRCERGAVQVRYTAGYPPVEDNDGNEVSTLPAPIRAAILLMVGDLYRNRETAAAVAMSSVPMSTTVETLLSPFRVFA